VGHWHSAERSILKPSLHLSRAQKQTLLECADTPDGTYTKNRKTMNGLCGLGLAKKADSAACHAFVLTPKGAALLASVRAELANHI
jgi:hypothetical protein